MKREQEKEKYNLDLLDKKEVVNKLNESLEEKELAEQLQNTENPCCAWNQWKKAVTGAADRMLKMEKGQIKRKNEWIQGDTLQMMEERRRIKDRTSTEYKRMCKRIYKKCIEDKTQWFDRRCKYIEKLKEEGKTREMHGEIKSNAKKSKRRRSIMVIKDEQGKMCTTEEEIQKVWIRSLVDKICRKTVRG